MTLSTDSARAQIVEILGCSIFHAKGLKESLGSEKDALATQDMDALMAAIEDKGTQVRELQVLDVKRGELCRESGFADGPEQMDRFTDWCDRDAEIARSWNQLLELADECNTLNLSNGAVIRVRRQQVDDGLSIIRGQALGAPTYGKNGVNRDGLAQRAIAEA
ncbi:MAG: flagellar protein FlgN [Pseudomonadota bacterium]